MSIPGLTSPVPANEESFDFTPPPESGSTTRTSKYFFEGGNYPAKAVSIVPYTAQSSGASMLLLTLVGTGGKAAGIDYKKYLPLTGKGAGITERILKQAFGIQKNETGAYKFKPSDVVSKDCTLKLVQETYNGKDRMAVADVLAPETTSTSEIPF